jgi:capsular polysaccharide biosynthesis protein
MEFAQNIQRNIVKAGRDQQFVEISFYDTSPKTAADVANAMVEELRKENSALRKGYAADVLSFVEAAYDRAKRTYDEADARRNKFRSENADALPEQEMLLTARIARLRIEQSEGQRAKEAGEIRLQQARAELRTLYAEASRSSAPTTVTIGGGGGAAASRELAKAEAELQSLRERYTPAHPKGPAAARVVELLQADVAEAEKDSPIVRQTAARVRIDAVPSGNDDEYADALLRYAQLLRSSDATVKQIIRAVGDYRETKAAVEHETRRIETAVKELDASLVASERLPQVRRELEVIDQDYTSKREQFLRMQTELDTVKKVYAIEMEDRGEQFSIVEPAVPPVSPAQSQRNKVILGAIVAGIALGVGFAVVADKLDRTFRQAAQLEEMLGIAVLAEIPSASPPASGTG